MVCAQAFDVITRQDKKNHHCNSEIMSRIRSNSFFKSHLIFRMAGRLFTYLPLKTLSRGSIQTAVYHTKTTSPLFTRITPRIALKQASRSISNQIEKEVMDPKEARGEAGEKAASDWQKRAPYRIHEPNEHFKARYEASCHCGKVKYQLSREEPLDSKLCHCTTCQTQHGMLTMVCPPNETTTLSVNQPLPSSGPPFFIKRTSTSLTATTIWNGTILARSPLSTSFPAKSVVLSVTVPLWTRGET